jgi:prepilin-type N-terminal cleavage/methylation domain-containing protein
MIRRNAFTLIELLTVIAITGILLTLIAVPLIQSFNLARAGSAFSDAQERARTITERVAREIGNAAFVRDGSVSVRSTLNGAAIDLPAHSLTILVPRRGATQNPNLRPIEVSIPYAKLDLVMPAEGDPILGQPGVYTNPNTGMIDPTLMSPRGQVNLPVTPGRTITRYWVGIRSPFERYENPYDGLLMARTGGRDNLFVLYRAEVEAYVWRKHKNDPSFLNPADPNGRFAYRPNLALFETDPSDLVIVDDPRFFTPELDGDGNPVDGQQNIKARRIRAWLGERVFIPGVSPEPPDPENPPLDRRVSNTIVMTEVSRYDMIRPEIDRRTREAIYEPADAPPYLQDAPRILSLVQFRPTRITAAPAEGQVAVRMGEETEGMREIGPDVFRTDFGLWENALVRTWPTNWSPGTPYLVGRNWFPQPGAPMQRFGVFAHDPSTIDENEPGVELFDVNTYSEVLAGGLYPFSQAMTAAHMRSGWMNDAVLRALFTPYVPDPTVGRVIASFGVNEIGNPGVMPSAANPDNLPTMPANPGTGPSHTPLNDPDLTGNWYDAKFAPINSKFNKIWNDFPDLRPDRVHRFIDLRVTPQPDGTPSILDPREGFRRARIVPGSEVIWGPDQNPGPNYGEMVRYTRTIAQPGPNQYRINYVDLPEPDYQALGFAQNPPANYDPTNFMSAIIQPRYRVGYLQLNSDPNVPLPPVKSGPNGPQWAETGRIFVYYRFQFTGPRDVMSVDYDTRQLMSVLLTVRNYPQATIPNPQTVTLKATATVRNYLR